MTFTATPVDGSTTPIPMSSAVPDGTNTPLAIEGGPSISTGGNTLVPVSMYVKDGNDVAQGTSTDANTVNSVMGRLTKIRDLLNATLPVSVTNVNANGQAVMVNSAPVVLASDQVHSSNSDGLLPTQLLASGMYIQSSGGPVDSTGKPQQAALDRLVSWQGKVLAGATANITSTLAGDTNLVFGAAPKTIMPGQKIALSIAAGNPVETVIVATSYTPSSTATTIPLQYPVVNAANTTAKWDIYSPSGPTTGLISPNNLLPTVLIMYDNNAASLRTVAAGSGDALANGNQLAVNAMLYNGVSMDRRRGNVDNVTLLASAARTTTQTIADQTNYNARGVVICVDTTVNAVACSNVVTINGKDPVSGKYQTLLTGAAIVGVSTVFYTIYPGVTPVANLSVSSPLPRTFQVVITAGNANSATYSVGASYIV